MQYRFVVKVEGNLRNFLKLRDTPNGDIIISQRGQFYSGVLGAFSVTGKQSQLTNITVHPNLRSRLGSISVNYKRKSGATESRKIAHVLGVKHSTRLFPVYTSIGRDLHSPSCDLPSAKTKRTELVELWPETGLDQSRDSMAFMVLLANPNVDFPIPDDFPRNVWISIFVHLQVIVFYWLFNRPTKPYWSNFVPVLGDTFHGEGMELHEALNYTNDLTMSHASHYETLPPEVER